MPSVTDGPAIVRNENTMAAMVSTSVFDRFEDQAKEAIAAIPPIVAREEMPIAALIEPQKFEEPSQPQPEPESVRTPLPGLFMLTCFAALASLALCLSHRISGSEWISAQALIIGLYGTANFINKKF